jgi:SNF2 family DNA or RNA helicase
MATVWLLSGTIMPNHVGELWSHLTALWPHTMKGVGYDEFLQYFTEGYSYLVKDGVSAGATRYVPEQNNQDTIRSLRDFVSSISLRRTAAEVLPDLPLIRYEIVGLATTPEATAALAGVTADDYTGDSMAETRRLVGAVKAPAVADIVAAELAEGFHKIAVFGHHTEVLDTLHNALSSYGVARIDGSTPTARRAGEVERFQTDPLCRVFIGQNTAAGVGITLTAASEVVLVESSWSPGENAQIAKRCHRISQDSPVRVRFFYLAETLDEHVTEVVCRKTQAIQDMNL